MKIDNDTKDKDRWKIVRRDYCTDVDGQIVTADEETGECSLSTAGGVQQFSFGPGGIKIVGRRR